MQKNINTPIGIVLLSLALSACTSVTPDTAAPSEPTLAPATVTAGKNEPVIENLVSEASLRRYTPVTPASGKGRIEPIITTVPMTANRVVERAINDFLQNRRTLMQMWIGRSQTYFPMIERIFAEEEVPDELKYLALGESSLNPTVRSSAGAVGMWQFMAATARGEGLRVDSWVDERRDPEKSTRAAARHLKALHTSYSGRWHLALAGYNCSYRCITRAVKKAGGSIDAPPTYWEIYPNLPKETREFVPRYIAAALIVSNPEFYGIPIEDLGQELAYDIVYVDGMLSLEDAARFAGTDLPSIKNLNPALLRNTLPNDPEPFALKIPLGSFERFTAAIAAVEPKGQSEAGVYVVKSGDTLGKIARNYKVSVADIQAINSIKGTLININQKLDIPGQSAGKVIQVTNPQREFIAYGKPAFKPIKLVDEFQLVKQSGSTEDKPLLAVRLSQIDEDEGALSLVPTIYKVRRGDTLGAISQRFGVSVASIQEGNNLRNHVIFPDQELTIHSATTATVAQAAGPNASTALQITPPYEVQAGDSLYGIARKFGTSVNVLKRLNNLRNNMIYPGQSLQVN